MTVKSKKLAARIRRKTRVREKIRADVGIPRICVFRSNRHVYAQLVDDTGTKVLTGCSTRAKDIIAKTNGKNNVATAKEVGLAVAALAKGLKIERVCFDRGGYKYHGKVKAIAEGAREGGLKF